MTITQLVAELDAKRKSITKGSHSTSIAVGTQVFLEALQEAYPKLRAAALAGERLAEAVEEVAAYPDNNEWQNEINLATVAFREATQ